MCLSAVRLTILVAKITLLGRARGPQFVVNVCLTLFNEMELIPMFRLCTKCKTRTPE